MLGRERVSGFGKSRGGNCDKLVDVEIGSLCYELLYPLNVLPPIPVFAALDYYQGINGAYAMPYRYVHFLQTPRARVAYPIWRGDGRTRWEGYGFDPSYQLLEQLRFVAAGHILRPNVRAKRHPTALRNGLAA